MRVRLNAPVAGDYRASLAVTFGCASIVRRVPLHASVAEPIISLPDLSFGTLPLGSGTRTSELSICNVGRGRIVFGPPVADSALELRGEGFAVARGELDRLRGASIGPGECFILHVSFTPTRPGTFTARARFLDNARRLRDTSIWSATVSADAGVEPAERAGYFIGSITPNPTVGAVTIPFTLGVAGWTTLTISDGLGKVVAAPVDEMQGAGEHRAAWDASGAAAGIYYCRITSGGWSAVRPIVVVR